MIVDRTYEQGFLVVPGACWTAPLISGGSADVTLDFRPVRAAPAGYTSEQDAVLADLSIIDTGRNAEAEGYDAVCIDKMSDSGLLGLRSLLSITVVGPGRASMLFALTLGERLSILMLWERHRHLYSRAIAELRLQDRCVSARSIGVPSDGQSLLSGREGELFPLLSQTVMRCVEEDGADVILLGSTTMHQAHAYFAERLPVPIINPGPLSYKLEERPLAWPPSPSSHVPGDHFGQVAHFGLCLHTKGFAPPESR
jgi:allantoin racemase